MNSESISNAVYHLTIIALPLLFSLSFHEAAHAWMAKRRGDTTAEGLGRLTLNPLAHIDLFGTILLPAILWLLHAPLFGWAKPVPIDYRNLKHPRRDNLLIALAGPVSNLILALVFAGCFHLLDKGGSAVGLLEGSGFAVREPLFLIFYYAVVLNLGMAFFNLLPLPALDGSHILAGLIPESMAAKLDHYQQYSFIIFIILVYSGALRFLAIPIRMAMKLLQVG